MKTIHQAIAEWKADKAALAAKGISFGYGAEPYGYATDEALQNYQLAMDALPTLATDPNAGVPSMLTTLVDPKIFKVLFSPLKAAEIYSEQLKGDWVMDTTMFPVVEHTGETAAYGDYDGQAQSRANINWPQRQSFLFQTHIDYGERELERVGLARISYAAELQEAAALALNKFQNFTYFFGVQGLQCYGSLNDPNLSAPLAPATKTAGGTAWIQSGVIKATANEIYADIEAMFYQLVTQTNDLIDRESEMTLAMSPQSSVALTATNTFNVNVSDLLKKNFPNMKFMTATQFGASSSSNQQGLAAGNLVQLIAPTVEGQETIFCAYNAKLRAHKLIAKESSWRQKMTSGTWGAILRGAYAIAQMQGV
jgi:predicted nuclease of predicted toxin-antitoxin system